MNFINNNIVTHLKSYKFLIFGTSILLLHQIGKRVFKKQRTTYFLMHCIFNAISVGYNYKNVITIIQNPLNITQVPNTLSFYVVLFHIYHLSFYQINLDEKIHHIAIVFVLCPLTWTYYTNICDFSMFFMTGLPGGITYLLLFLKDLKYITPYTEKHISKHLNMWIRAPGCVISAYIIYLNYHNNAFQNTKLNTFITALSIIGSLWNGMYFASTIIESYLQERLNKTQVIYNPN